MLWRRSSQPDNPISFLFTSTFQMESALASRDVVEAMLSFLDHKSLLHAAALVCLGWREALDGPLAEEACRWAFWRYYRSQDETYPFDVAAMSPFPLSWRAECKARHMGRWRPAIDGEQLPVELTTGSYLALCLFHSPCSWQVAMRHQPSNFPAFLAIFAIYLKRRR